MRSPYLETLAVAASAEVGGGGGEPRRALVSMPSPTLSHAPEARVFPEPLNSLREMQPPCSASAKKLVL